MPRNVFVGVLTTALTFGQSLLLPAAEPATPTSPDIFAKKNLVAWCIVPFDSKKRGPEDRAAMLEKLGFSKFAYDYRAEHIPAFDAEIEALKRHRIELFAWWFPTSLNDEAKMTLAVFEKHKVTPQLWVTGSGAPTKNEQEQQQRVRDEAARIRPIAEAAAKVGCKVALYNHGGWFGEPENQIAIIRELNLPNVGIVYNQHHGHDHLDRFPELLRKMMPYLYTLNLNGMVKDGERKGQKILQLGEGDLDLTLLKVIRDSGYSGPIGILGHTSDDAEERLHDNLDGLDWLLPQLKGKPAGPKPKMRTPVPVAQAQAAAVPNTNVSRLTDGKFGNAIDGRAGGAFVARRDEFRQFPITVECWTKQIDKTGYNILVAHELKSSGTHWELFSMAGTGNFTVYTPGFSPDHSHSDAQICDGKWHHVSMILEADRIRLFVDGRPVADQVHQRTDMKPVPGNLSLASLVDQQIGCTGLVDEVRISRGIRTVSAIPDKPFVVDDSTIALWHLDELVDQKRFNDATTKNSATIEVASLSASPGPAKRPKIEGHWGEDALGFRWTENDSRDDRFGQMDTGPFFSGSITGPGGIVFKGIVVRLGDQRSASICYDTELMRASAGWTGFLKFDAARYGIIVPPSIEGSKTFTTPLLAGWSRTDQFTDFRANSRYGGLPKTEAHYEGLYRHGQRVVLKFMVGTSSAGNDQQAAEVKTLVLESPWFEQLDGASAISRTFAIGPSTTPLKMLVAEEPAHVRIVTGERAASLQTGPRNSRVLVVPPHSETVTVKLLVAAANVDEAAFDKLAGASPAAEDLLALTKPGPTIWGMPLETVGEVSKDSAPFVVDTITLPFENPFKALMFCGGHDVLPDGRAFVCTLHGDVWLVDGIDETLKQIKWRRFATGLFQPLGVKLVPSSRSGVLPDAKMDLYVVGRDQITRLYDSNGDGEADHYENFNNDAYVSLNGHEYVTCLETDRAGNFYFVKGNCDSAIPHDGSLLQVSPDGSKLEVFATGFRNANGIAIGPNDELTVAPQEGEWTPGSCVFDVHKGGFYGGFMSHHRSTPPKDFERPICWFPRLADNSCGGQVWIPSDHWGPLAGHLLHLSYGQCKLRLLMREQLPGHIRGEASSGSDSSQISLALRRSPLVTMNGGSTELPLSFASGIHRGRFSPKDGHLYLTGLKGWVTSAVNDGCFQRVRYTGQPAVLLAGMKTYRNGVELTFTGPLSRDEAEKIDNYQLEAWNIHWSAAYGSPDLKPSAPGQVGRDAVEPKSVTLLDNNRSVFIEIPDLAPVDQLGVSYSMRSAEGTAIEQTAYLTLNGIPDRTMREEKLHRSIADVERAELLARLSPGVILSSSSNPSVVQSRLLAWANPASSSTEPRFTATGYIKIPATSEYRFSIDSEQMTRGIEIEIDGQKRTFDDKEIAIRLRKGIVKFRVSPLTFSKDSTFRLMWQSDSFPRELIPPTVLFHETTADPHSDEQSKLSTGRSLFVTHQCARCHVQTDDQAADQMSWSPVEQQRHAPSLEGIGSRVNSDWIAKWLRNPSHFRADATMPRLVDSRSETDVADLVSYLASLRDVAPLNGVQDAPTDVKSVKSNSKDELSAIERGTELFERLGCIACHTFAATDPNPEWNRVSLQFAGRKFQAGQLEKFLRAPHRHHLGSHMPDYRLSDDEAQVLSAYIQKSSLGTLDEFSSSKAVDPQRGRKLFSELRCDRCHQVSASNALAAADVRSAFIPAARTGCLGPVDDKSERSPKFKWTEAERESLRFYLNVASRGKLRPDDTGHSAIPKALASLRCSACHARDAVSAKWPEIVADEGSGRLTEIVPQLTWVGEKLQGPWIAKLLKGELKQKPRPWIAARMPAFPEYADIIAHGMANEHGVAFAEAVPTKFDGDQVEIGRQLTLRDGGLDCRQCHGLGKQLPQGDVKTQIALGINFALARDRLRPEFVLRQLFDPPRYDNSSRMPRFAPDLKSTAAKHLADGNARKQFEALKQYLFSVNVDD